jgi:peptide/nickel transport system substrate-binding protein
MVAPQHAIEKNGEDYFRQHPVGDGPWKFTRHVPGDSFEYEAMDKHYRQVPLYKKLTIVLIPEETTRMAMLKTGTIDAGEASVEAASEMETAGFQSVELMHNADNVVFPGTFMPEAANMPSANIKVRQALAHAINSAEIGQTLMHGKYGVPAPGGNSYNVADLDVSYWQDYCAKAWSYDPALSKKLLAEAGYPNGFDIKMYSFTMGGGPHLPKLAEIIQGYWKAIGVNAQIIPSDWGVVSKWRTSGPGGTPQPQLIGTVEIISSSESIVAAYRTNGTALSTGSWSLFGKTRPDLDALLNASTSETDANKRREIISSFSKIIADSYLVIGLGTPPVLASIRPGLLDISKVLPGSRSIVIYAGIMKHTQ